ncbi:hypothetical protein Sjap_001505 [Stephania japonica]|uniref:Protein FLC EXPRESSOR n=1 Tax=Stephania japonica TaxID=461633 RepID=A0AAP0KKY9_9MAGN
MSSRNRHPQHAPPPHREPPLKSRAPPHQHPHPHPPPPLLHPPHLLHRPSPSAAPAPDTALAERAIAQHAEIQALLLDNQRLAATHVALNQELSASKKDLARLSEASVRVKAEGDAKVREVFDRSLALEAELRSVDAARAELAQVRANVSMLRLEREEMAAKLQGVNGEVKRARAEFQSRAPAINAEIGAVLHEIQRGRAAIEYEKKIRGDNLEHSLAMQKTMKALAHEIEKLRAELANAEKRARAAATVPTAAANTGVVHSGASGNPDVGFEGTSYVDPYSFHKGQGGADVDPNKESGTILHSSNDTQQNHLHR